MLIQLDPRLRLALQKAVIQLALLITTFLDSAALERLREDDSTLDGGR